MKAEYVLSTIAFHVEIDDSCNESVDVMLE